MKVSCFIPLFAQRLCPGVAFKAANAKIRILSHSDSHTFLHPSFPAPLSWHIAVQKQRSVYLFHPICVSLGKSKTTFSSLKCRYASGRELQCLRLQPGLTKAWKHPLSANDAHNKEIGQWEPFVGTEVTWWYSDHHKHSKVHHTYLCQLHLLQVRLYSAFQCFHLLLMMLWAKLTGRKHWIILAPIPLAVVACLQPRNNLILSSIYGIFHNLLAVNFHLFSSLLNRNRFLHGAGFTCSP